jgi:MFS family permease
MADARLDSSVLTPGRRPLTIGIVLVITAIAFEALAVSTALPVVSRELNGVRLYGWAFSGFMLANLVGISLAGPLADRIGPVRPLVAGMLLFGAGLFISGLAPTMLIVVVGRLVAGAGAGALISTAYVVIGMGYPEAARARLFAVLSSAWVVPSLIGPSIAGAVADHLSWRLVFLGLTPIMVIDAALILPAMRSLRAIDMGPQARARVPLPVVDALRLAVGAGLLLSGFTAGNWVAGAALVVVGFALAWNSFRRLVPPGTLRARGPLATAVALRGLLAFTFFTFDAFLPLTLTSLRNQSPTRAGLSLTAGGVSWATATWVAERRGLVWGRRKTATIGAAMILLGISVAALVLIPSVPVLVAPLGWLLAGGGMGLCYPTLSLTVLDEAAEGAVGRASASLQLTDVLGVALGTGLAGAAVAYSEAAGWGRRPGIELADGLTVVVGLVALAVARRMPLGAAGAAARAVPPGGLPGD